MVTTLEHGITIQSAAAAAIVQDVKVTAKKEKSLISGMVSTKTEVVKVFEHTETNDFEVAGKGDLTLVPGISTAANITTLTGGVIFIEEFMYHQKIGEESDWSYKGSHYPHAA